MISALPPKIKGGNLPRPRTRTIRPLLLDRNYNLKCAVGVAVGLGAQDRFDPYRAVALVGARAGEPEEPYVDGGEQAPVRRMDLAVDQLTRGQLHRSHRARAGGHCHARLSEPG